MNRLEQFVDRLMAVADKRNLAYENPVTIMIDVGQEQFYVVVSHAEPNHVTLPLNVTWIVADPESPNYRKALRRASALPFDGLRNTWAELRTYEDFTEELQFWDLSATFQFGEIQVPGVKEATPTRRGLFSLNREAGDPDDPVVVGDNDERMSNPRQPLPHQHPLLPSTMLAGSTGINEFYVIISEGGSPAEGQILCLTEPGDEEGEWNGIWRYPTAADIVYDGPTVQEIVINGPADDQVEEGTPVPFTATAVFTDGSTIESIAAEWEIIANTGAGTISTSTGVFTSADVSGDQVVRIRASWVHEESGEQHQGTYDLTVIDTTVVAVLERIELSGVDSIDEGGNTSQFTVTAFYDDGSSRGVTPTTFTSSNLSAGSLNSSTGMFTSAVDVVNNQTTTLNATYTENGVTVSDALDLTVVDTTVYPESAVIQGPVVVAENTEETYVLVVTFTDQTSSQVAVSDWAIDNASAGVIGSSDGVLQAPTNLDADEIATISASFTSNGRTVNASYEITVTDETVYPVNATVVGPNQIDEGEVVTYQLEVEFSDGTTSFVSVSDWSHDTASAGSIGPSSGEFTASEVTANTDTVISASYTQSGDTVSDTLTLTVLDTTNYPVSARIVGNATMGEGSTQDLDLEVTYQDNTTAMVVADSWVSSDDTLLPVSAIGEVVAKDGLRTDSFATITANYSENGVDLAPTLTITVTDDTLYPTGAQILGPIVVNEGTTVGYSLEVTYEGGGKQVEPVNTFAIDNASAGTITNDGRLSAPADVTSDVATQVSASFTLDGTTVSATLDITVTDDTVYPASAQILGPVSIDEETVHTYELEVTYTDATKGVVTVSDWDSSNTAAATIDTSTGQLTALSLAEDAMTTISASFTENGTTVGDTMDITVRDVTNYPVSAQILGVASVPENGTATYELEVTFKDSTVQKMPVTNWASSNTNAGVINATTGAFQARANVTADVNTTISASYTAFGQTVSDTHLVTVTDETAYPVSATLNGPVTVDENTDAQYTLRVVFDDSSERDVPATDWAVDNPAAGSIVADTGVFSAAENGTGANITTVVSASWNVDGVEVSDQKTIGVVDTTVYLESAEVQGAGSVDEGASETYQLRVFYTDGSDRVVSVEDWGIDSGGAFATIDPVTGVLTADANFIGDKTVTISASFTEGGITVGDNLLINLADVILRPISLDISGQNEIDEGQSDTYSAVVTYDNGSTASVSLTDWATDNAAASIDATTGELTANQVDADTDVIITGSYTENGATANGSFTMRVIDVYAVSAAITGPTSVLEGTTAQYEMNVTFSDSSVDTRAISDWATSDEAVATIDASTGELTAVMLDADTPVTISGSYTENGYTVNATLDITVTDTPPVTQALPKWGYAPYAGPDLTAAGDTVQSFLDALPSDMPSESNGEEFTYDLPDGNTYAYFAHPKSLGLATFTDTANNFAGSWDGASWQSDLSNMDNTGPIEVTYDDGSGPAQWYVYRTDWPGPSNNPSTFRVDYAG
tara:strand:- start:62637 stop:67133 length:4497 start_codon:yes stop_codon:yes gene_type:complete